jgi:uncharacterized protein with GYD domain
MATFFMLGKYSLQGLMGISVRRTNECNKLVKKLGGNVKSIYALLGKYDLAIIVDFPNSKEAMRASVELAKKTGIAFTTSEAICVKEFDKLMAKK